jgi:hypothetical protein
MKGRLRREFSDPRARGRGRACDSCGADERLQPYRVGAIEGERLLCRRCLAKAKAAEERERPPNAP